MEGNKLELSGKRSNELPASYKPIQEMDMKETAVTRPKSLVKIKTNSPEIDGADEKMLPKDDDKVAPNSNIAVSDVKITTNEKQNGDAKLDIGDVKDAFVGLTKEELMKYANDPFWIRLRWFLFITFWVLWAAMLVGAVMIIYAAPKCEPPPPRTWYEEGPLIESTQYNIPNEELKSLKEKGVKGIIIGWPGDDTYTTIDEGHEFVAFIKQAKDNNINVIVDLKPGTSNVWFEKSLNRDSEYNDFYLWKASKAGTSANNPEPPNNWLSIKNVSSWFYSDDRKEFYYAPSGKPQLNFRNPNVTNKFTDIIKTAIKYGASGIRIRDAAHLLVDPKFENEHPNTNAPGFVHTDYGFYLHTKTKNLPELAPLLMQWRKIVKNGTENGPFMVAEGLGNANAYRINGSLVVDLPLESELFSQPQLNASNIAKRLNNVFNITGITWPLWKYNTTGVLDIVTFLLPGTPLANKDAPTNSELLKIRSSPSVMRGIFNYTTLANQTVFAFIRVTSGNPGILVALNPSDQQVIVDFPAAFQTVPGEVTVQLFSSNYNETEVALNMKHDSRSLPISPHAAIVLSYVPIAP